MRVIQSPAEKVRFDVFEVDLRAGELRRDGRRIKLQEQPFRVLSLLLQRTGEAVTREELRERLWPVDTFVDFDHGLNSAVARLREALRDSAEKPRFIETIAKRGYRFIGQIEADKDSERSSADAAAPTSGGRERLISTRIWVGVTICLALLSTVSIWALYRPQSGCAIGKN
jgi:DNA-binding winged helix-turn-helix (wHTH) protein